jgi:hypothetical protein
MPNSSARSRFITPSAAAGSEVCMNKHQFFVHNDSDARRIELAVSLSGADVEIVLPYSEDDPSCFRVTETMRE